MTNTINFLNERRLYLGIGLVWVLLWVIPWGKPGFIRVGIFLTFLIDMIFLGIAIMIFIFPGILLYILLIQDDKTEPNLRGIIPIGFTFSVLIIAVVGLVGRIFGLSFTVVKTCFALIGLLEIFLLASSKPDYIMDIKRLQRLFSSVFRNSPLILALILATLMTFHDQLFFIDDTTYLAYLTNWQYATELGFKNIVHEVDVIEHMRFWLAMYPMGQALLADLSGLPGLLLIGNYLELYLVPLAVITSYWFARTLGLSRKAAGFSVLIQITLYAWMLGDQFPVGMWFYQSMSEDKVSAAFIFAPVFFVFGLNIIQNPGRKRWIPFLLTGVGLSLTHPVILFFASCIILCMSIIALIIKKTGWRNLFQLIIIVSSVMLPYLVIRDADSQSSIKIPYNGVSASKSFEIERYTRVVSDIFYGLNPGVLKFLDFEVEDGGFNNALQLFRLIPIVITILGGIIVWANLKKGPLYWYISSCILLIVFAVIPYTGWILGYFVSARLISRTSWFSPMGMSGVLVLMAVSNWLKRNYPLSRMNTILRAKNYSGTMLGLAACFIFISPVLIYNFIPRIPTYFEILGHNKELAQVGLYIDQNTTDPVMAIALDYWDTQLLPGVSAHTRLISFREEKDYNPHNIFYTIDEIHERIYTSNIIRSMDLEISESDRCNEIEKIDLKFVLADSENAELFRNIVGSCQTNLEVAFETNHLVLLTFENSDEN